MFYKLAKLIVKPIIYLLFRPRIKGIDNFPMQGKVIIYSNHTSLWDPIIIASLLPRQVFFMAKIELFNVPILSWILRKVGAFPVKRGTPDLSAVKASLQVLKDEKVFGIFPEGTRSEDGDIKDFSHGIASIAHKSKSKVIPICVLNRPIPFKTVTIKIGPPLEFADLYKEKSSTILLEEMCTTMKETMKSLIKE